MTYYLKYRPQKFAELDLLKVREELARTVKSGNIPHAFLFAGPRGAGKTSAARILAKAINCERREERSEKNFEPCNECAQCVAITNGSSLDVIEIDAASNRGVDDIRTLREGVRLSPATALKKVYIIDEAHMLTNEASNALLKTLEEPPVHVVFILATTSPGKLLDTIRSRCTTVVFPRATNEEIIESLKKVVKGESLDVEAGALGEISGRVDGSFREAHKVLEQAALGKERVTLSDLKGKLSISGDQVEAILRFLGEGKTKEALEEISKVVQSGVDLKAYATEILTGLREVLVSEYGIGEAKFEAEAFGGVERVRILIELFSQAAKDLSGSVIAQLPLELVVVKWGRGSGAGSQPILLLDNSTAPGSTDSRGLRAVENSDFVPLESVSNTSNVRELLVDPSSGGGGEREEDSSKKAEPAPVEEKNALGEGVDLEEKWKAVMKEVLPKNRSVEALLRATKPRSYDGRTLTLEVFYQFHKERIEKDPYRSVVEEIATQVLGTPVKLACFLAQQKQKAIDIANITERVDEDIVAAAEDIFGASAENTKDFPN